MQITRIDHLVLTVASIDRSVEFYTRVLGMEKIEFGEGRIALAFGEQKINLHQPGQEIEPHAANVAAGCAR
jgi:catechol 2,3-dioxygenase-like lactoylglutathione lyase family enzyme